MITFIEAIILGLVQGITEFLPVSSSGHLALIQNYFQINESVLGFDIMLHLATLIAVCLFFYKDIFTIVIDILQWRKTSEHFWLGWFVLIATIPAGFVGFFMRDLVEKAFSSLLFVGVGFLISGIFLFIASFVRKNLNNSMSIKSSIIVGFAQALAIFPGISRSGSTISTSLLSGIDREKAIKFSFLLSIPVILGAVLLDVRHISWSWVFILGFISAFVSGFFSILFFVKYIRVANLKWFAFYCWFLALLVLLMIIL